MALHVRYGRRNAAPQFKTEGRQQIRVEAVSETEACSSVQEFFELWPGGSVKIWYNCYTIVRFHFSGRKSRRLRTNPKRGIGFEEAQEIFSHPYYLDQRSDVPEQHRAIGWVGGRLYSVIFEVREDSEGEYYHLVTLWKATKQEQQLYEQYSS